MNKTSKQEKIDDIVTVREEAVDASAFHESAYGYGDLGRSWTVWWQFDGSGTTMVRIQIFSGTHAISSALFGVLRPGDTMLAVSGHP